MTCRRNFHVATLFGFCILLLAPLRARGEVVKWGPDPVKVKNQVLIGKDDSLLVEKGTSIEFSRAGKLIVNGTARFAGTLSAPIVISASEDREEPLIIFGGSKPLGPEKGQPPTAFARFKLALEAFVKRETSHGSFMQHTAIRSIQGTKAAHLRALVEISNARLSVEYSSLGDFTTFNAFNTQQGVLFLRNNYIQSCNADSIVHQLESIGVFDGNVITSQCKNLDRTQEGFWSDGSVVVAYRNVAFNLGDDGAQALRGFLLGVQNHFFSNYDDGFDATIDTTAVLLRNALEHNRSSGVKAGAKSDVTSLENQITGNHEAYGLYNSALIRSSGDHESGNGIRLKDYGSLRNYFRREEKDPKIIAEFVSRMKNLIPSPPFSEAYYIALDELNFDEVKEKLKARGDTDTVAWFNTIEARLKAGNSFKSSPLTQERSTLQKYLALVAPL